MKKLVVTLVVMLIASYAMAGAYVDWRCASGFFTADSTDAQVYTSGDDYPLGNIGVGQSVLWALMYTTDVAPGTPTVTTVGAVSTVHSDTVLATRYFAAGWADMNDTQFANGVGYDPGLFRIAGDQTSDDSWRDEAHSGVGNIYQAVFANVSYNAGVITFTDASIYYTFTAFDNIDFKNFGSGTPPTQQPNDSGSTYAGVRVDSVLNAVPEPATMGLLGLGALVMAIRRRRS